MSEMPAIPAHLLRDQGPQKKRRASGQNLHRWAKIPNTRKPKGKRWAKAERAAFFLHDEAPAIGCGNRLLWFAVGRKWVAISDGIRTARLTTAAFEGINGGGGRS